MANFNKNLVYDIVVTRIMEALDKGIVPWKQTWTSTTPFNAVSNKPYRGINMFLLSIMPYKDPRYLTFKQVTDLDGKVIKGSKSTPVVFWSMNRYNDAITGEEKMIPFLKYYNVFNVEQCEGLKLKPLEKNNDKITTGESIVDGYNDKPIISHGAGMRPCYIPSKDEVQIPPIGNFNDSDKYYSVLFHELGHSTGASSRLNRKGVANFDAFGTAQYSEEELIAEFSSAFLCAEAGISNDIAQVASYIDGWKKYIITNPKDLITCASKAQKAVDYILGKNHDDTTTEVDSTKELVAV